MVQKVGVSLVLEARNGTNKYYCSAEGYIKYILCASIYVTEIWTAGTSIMSRVQITDIFLKDV